MLAPTSLEPPVTDGPRWYRTRIRRYGPLAGLLVPAVLGGIAWAALRVSDAGWSGAVGLIAGVCAAPALLAAGAPFGDDGLYPIAVAASAVMWLLIGWLAARKATRNPMATWRDYWRHYGWLCGGICLGACAALAVSAWVVADPLL
ncbi:MAG: hypothetical protein AAFY28_21540 [Actinomycetota bacterium]